jgi:hypothetical protein
MQELRTTQQELLASVAKCVSFFCPYRTGGENVAKAVGKRRAFRYAFTATPAQPLRLPN